MEPKRLYRAGIYLRLSRDDDAGGTNQGSGIVKKESNSISSQRELIRAYVSVHEDIEIYDMYVDDGYSGANFDRPSFRRMMEDVLDGRVDCIIVKDLSRFGRDYIEAGRFIQKTLPALKVRFIAVTDHFDSLTADYNETSLVLPVKNFVNDSYCRDISGKVKSHQKIKREKGEFIGAFTVYGYRKAAEDKNKLVPDEYAAQIVRNIYTWKLEGMSCLAIAGRLNALGILSPAEYKKSKGERFTTAFQTGVKATWSSMAVKRILTNELYAGTMVQGKSERINYKVDKYRKKPAEEWVRVENTHEPIIQREEFDDVQRFLTVGGRAVKGEKKAHMFSGLLFCGDCKEAMLRRISRYGGTEKVTYICPSNNRGKGCTRHSIAEEDLKEVLFNGLKMQAALLIDKMKVRMQIEKLEVNYEELGRLDRELERLRREQDKYLALKNGLFGDLEEGVITEGDFDIFRKIFQEQYARTREEISKQEELFKCLSDSGEALGIRLEHFKEVPELTELSRAVLVTFIRRILVYEDKRIGMELRTGGELGRILRQQGRRRE